MLVESCHIIKPPALLALTTAFMMLSIVMLRTERAVEVALSSAVHVPVRTKVFQWGSQERACPSAVCHLIIEGLHPPGLFNTATSLSIKLTNKRFSSKPLVLGTVPWVSFFWQSSPCAHMCWIVATPTPHLSPAAGPSCPITSEVHRP